MLAQRILTAVVGIPLLLVPLYFGGMVWRVLVLLIIIAGLVEFSRISGPGLYLDYLLLSGLSFLAVTYSGIDGTKLLFWLVFQLLYYLIRATFSGMHSFSSSFNILGVLYVVVLYSFLVLVREEFGIVWTLYGLAITWLTDTGAYFGGIRYGMRRLASKISEEVCGRCAVRPAGSSSHRGHLCPGCRGIPCSACAVWTDTVGLCPAW